MWFGIHIIIDINKEDFNTILKMSSKLFYCSLVCYVYKYKHLKMYPRPGGKHRPHENKQICLLQHEDKIRSGKLFIRFSIPCKDGLHYVTSS